MDRRFMDARTAAASAVPALDLGKGGGKAAASFSDSEGRGEGCGVKLRGVKFCCRSVEDATDSPSTAVVEVPPVVALGAVEAVGGTSTEGVFSKGGEGARCRREGNKTEEETLLLVLTG